MPTEIGARSPHDRLFRLDGRTKEGQFMRRTAADLIYHLGGPEHINAAQRIMCERIAADLLKIELIERKVLDGRATHFDMVVMHALRNTTRIGLRDLGLETRHKVTKGQGAAVLEAARSSS
jgi:hypothetical protein